MADRPRLDRQGASVELLGHGAVRIGVLDEVLNLTPEEVRWLATIALPWALYHQPAERSACGPECETCERLHATGQPEQGTLMP